MERGARRVMRRSTMSPRMMSPPVICARKASDFIGSVFGSGAILNEPRPSAARMKIAKPQCRTTSRG